MFPNCLRLTALTAGLWHPGMPELSGTITCHTQLIKCIILSVSVSLLLMHSPSLSSLQADQKASFRSNPIQHPREEWGKSPCCSEPVRVNAKSPSI